MKLAIQTELDYHFNQPTDVLLQVEAAMIPEQVVETAHIDLPPTEHFARVPGHDTIGDRLWLRLEGEFRVSYTATVSSERLTGDLGGLAAVPPHRLPSPTVQYLMPSRYCPSDQFQNLVEAEFGSTQGGARIAAMRDWIEANIAYVPGASDPFTGALQTYVSRCGVCRDFAHVLIAMARASAIPARYASVYGLGVNPQDFHAVAEVFLDGAWHLVDPTGMADAVSMAKIAVGRDAAYVSFLTSYGPATFNNQTVSVTAA